eukprot:7107015-Pyramimonas_sp.AAC.1
MDAFALWNTLHRVLHLLLAAMRDELPGGQLEHVRQRQDPDQHPSADVPGGHPHGGPGERQARAR